MSQERYFLSSLESTAFGATRECTFLKRLRFDSGKECVLAELTPPVIGQQFGVAQDIRFVVLASRHEGYMLTPIVEFPCFVFIARVLAVDLENVSVISSGDLEVLAWGELYRTRLDADNHVFD